MEKYLLDDDGSPLLDENGKKLLNPEWLAANPSYTPAADEAGHDYGGFTPDAETMAWHNEQVAGLKKAQSKALTTNAKNRKRADEAEARVAELEAENERLRAGGNGDEDIQAQIDAEVTARVKTITGERDAARGEVASLKSELSKHRYEGRIERAALGVIHPDKKFQAMATLKSLIREDENGDVTCYDMDGERAVDNTGGDMSVETFVNEVFRTQFSDMCLADAGAPANGNNGAIKPPKANNPFAKESLNRTVQSQILKNDPDRARTLMKQAGYDSAKINRLLAA